MSQEDEAERESERQYDGNDGYNQDEKNSQKSTKKWRRTVEQALVKMTAEIAALREQIASGREYQGKKQRTVGKWISWLFWVVVKHFVVDAFILSLVLLWLRKRKDRRLEDLVRQGLKIGREYARKVLPPR